MVIRKSAVEDLGVNKSFWRNKRVLITGHTGFKGSWLTIWLKSMGAQIQGLALDPPTNPSLFVEASVSDGIVSNICDICDYERVNEILSKFQPEVILHLAAQPLVRHSYDFPLETYTTNVIGLVNLFEAARKCETLKVIVNVTTDKCYENKEWVWGYREDEPMGGFDPYSSSKGCAELVTSAYRRSYFASSGVALASARAGNVIGGGDWAKDRLIPDILRAFSSKEPVVIRNPESTRPWQHVIEPLSGYLLLAESLWNNPTYYAEGWNFGPKDDDAKPVKWIVDKLIDIWGNGACARFDDSHQPHEASYLKLDISKAGQKLGWKPRWSLESALSNVVSWQQAWESGKDVRALCLEQINLYLSNNLGSHNE